MEREHEGRKSECLAARTAWVRPSAISMKRLPLLIAALAFLGSPTLTRGRLFLVLTWYLRYTGYLLGLLALEPKVPILI